MNFDNLKEQIDEKITKKNQKLLIYLGGILLLIIGYFVIFSPLKEANDTLAASVTTMTQQRDTYREYDAHKAENVKATAKMEKELKEILGRYPQVVYEEDIITAEANLEGTADIQISNITCENTNLVTSAADMGTDNSTTTTATANTTGTTATATDQTVQNAQATDETTDTAANKYQLFVKPSTVTFSAGYEGIKAVAAFVKNGAFKKNIESIYLTYDADSGLLTGNMMVNFYSIEGEDIDNDAHEVLGEVAQGQTNVFKTVR